MRSKRSWSLLFGVVVVVATVGACVPPDPSLPPVADAAIVALDIVPAGAYSQPYGGDVGVEARMYDSLTPLGANVTDADVAAGFKSARLGFPDGERPRDVERPKAGVLIQRDRFNVPYVTASTDRDARWAVGWLAASHAPVIYEAARSNARIAALRVPDVDVFSLSTGLQVLAPSAAAEAALDAQVADLRAMGPEGEAVYADILAFVAGYNANLDATLSPLPRWTPRDIVALAAFKSNWWGGGSPEYVYPEGFPEFDAAAVEDASNPSPHRPGDPHGIPAYRPNEVREASNFALVSGERSSTGHPLMIGGPEIGFLYPSIVFEVDIQSPNISMRGLTAPSSPGYVLIGRGRNFAWTMNVSRVSTSVGYVVSMCDPSGAPITPEIQGVVVDGVCRPVTRTRVGSTGSLNDLLAPRRPIDMVVSEFGPVGSPWVSADGGQAVIFQNPSSGKDYLDLVALRGFNQGPVDGPESFRAAMQRTPQAFNVGYVDDEHIAAFQTCFCVTPPTDDLPVADPTSLLQPVSAKPSTVDPPNGVITNWNERLVTDNGDFVPPAEGEFRRDWFDAFDRIPQHSPTSIVAAMNGEAVKDGFGGTISFQDLTPFLPGARPPVIQYTARSSGIQMVMSFGASGTR